MNLKKMVGYKAAEFVENHTVVGLGTGTTAKYLVEALAKRIDEEGLEIVGVTTSNQTAELAKELGISLKELDEVDEIALTIDGADEISKDFHGIKGGGASHLFEKMVATYSKKNIWIVDESKMVKELGAFGLPVEIIKFGSEHTFKHFDAKGYQPNWRLDDNGERLVTDDGNYIVDLGIDVIENPYQLAQELEGTVGVVEHGLFLEMVDTIVIGTENGPEVKVVK